MKSQVISVREINKEILEVKVEIPRNWKAGAGQFVEVTVEGFFLRRPISICDVDGDQLTLVFKESGRGTEKLARLLKSGQISELDIIGPFGNGFPIDEIAALINGTNGRVYQESQGDHKNQRNSVDDQDSTQLTTKKLVLVGGGIGIPPLYQAAKEALELGLTPSIYLGFNSDGDVFYIDEFKKLGVDVVTAVMKQSMEGSWVLGSVIDALTSEDPRQIIVCGCGPIGMLSALEKWGHQGYLSFESRMACGYGICMGCAVKQTDGKMVRVCKEGPVFKLGQIDLQQRFI